MAYPLPYKFTDWIGFKKDCPDHTGVFTSGYSQNNPGYYRNGWSEVNGSSTNKSILKTLIGGSQTGSSLAAAQGVFFQFNNLGGSILANKVIFMLNNANEDSANPPDSWSRLLLSWVISGVTYSAEFDRTNASLALRVESYSIKSWWWIWPNPGVSGVPPWGGTVGQTVTWTVTQSTA
jgi:hypothetical protein